MPSSRIEIGICTFRRNSVLDTILSVANQTLDRETSARIIVVDNDDTPSRRADVDALAANIGVAVTYIHAPARNISIARNACLDEANGDFLAFIDDDEIAGRDWLAKLISAAQDSKAGVVFGPAHAIYPDNAPAWMIENNIHSNVPSRNAGIVETGFSSNALLDLRDRRVSEERFDTRFGRTGGEDVDFFFRLHRKGVLMDICPDASVREKVDPARMSFSWVFLRRLTTGKIYGHCRLGGGGSRWPLFLGSLSKTTFCGLRALTSIANQSKLMFWLMRGTFHAGVMSGTLNPPRREFYGQR